MMFFCIWVIHTHNLKPYLWCFLKYSFTFTGQNTDAHLFMVFEHLNETMSHFVLSWQFIIWQLLYRDITIQAVNQMLTWANFNVPFHVHLQIGKHFINISCLLL